MKEHSDSKNNYSEDDIIKVLEFLHSKMCNVRLSYVKHALNTRYDTYVKRMNRVPRLTFVFLPYVIHAFGKYAFKAWYEKHAFNHPLKSLMLTYYSPCIKIVFSKRTFNAHFGKRMLYKTPVLLDVRKMCVNPLAAWWVICVLLPLAAQWVIYVPRYFLEFNDV